MSGSIPGYIIFYNRICGRANEHFLADSSELFNTWVDVLCNNDGVFLLLDEGRCSEKRKVLKLTYL